VGALYKGRSVPGARGLSIPRHENRRDHEQCSARSPGQDGCGSVAIQRILHEQARFVPIYQQAQINGVGPRVDDSGATLIKGYPYFAPYEDLRLKKP